MNLYIVYLGGAPQDGRLGEDHEVVAVVAASLVKARNIAKTKWSGVGAAHVALVQHLDVVGGYQVRLQVAPEHCGDIGIIDRTWTP